MATLDQHLDTVAATLARPWKQLAPKTCPPILAHASSRKHCTTVTYGNRGLRADIWKRHEAQVGAPVLLYVPGGAWISGRRVGQGYAMFHHLVDRGYTCVSIDYRTSPANRWPAHLHDVQDAVEWVRKEFDPPFLALSGASAGGHLASLAGLTGAPVDAVVSLYGAYDWLSRSTLVSLGTGLIAGALVVQRPSIKTMREASPITHVHADAPPFLILQGASDRLTPAVGARRFHHALSEVSRARCEYLEVAGGHGFDLLHCESTRIAIDATDRFLADVQDEIQAAC